MSSEKPPTPAPTPDLILPGVLPLFTLPSILLLPRGRLPMNIYEPRYRAMIDDALGHSSRIIGIIQQLEPETSRPVLVGEEFAPVTQALQEAGGDTPALYPVGCAGRIMTFSETEKGNYLISLQGICRFSITEELSQHNGYRRVKPDWSHFAEDRAPAQHGVVDRTRLFAALRNYFKIHGIIANWDVIKDTDDEHLVISLSMTCPFAPWEHQALLEAPNLAERARLLLSLIEMAALDQGESEMVRH